MEMTKNNNDTFYMTMQLVDYTRLKINTTLCLNQPYIIISNRTCLFLQRAN